MKKARKSKCATRNCEHTIQEKTTTKAPLEKREGYNRDKKDGKGREQRDLGIKEVRRTQLKEADDG